MTAAPSARVTSPAAGRAAVDAGQSGIRVRVATPGGPAVRVDTAPLLTDRPVVPQVALAVADALDRLGGTVGAVAAGVSGLTDKGADAAGLLAALAPSGVVEAMLAHDSVTAYLGASGTEPGAVVAAGTGVVTLGVGERVARVDGWGNLFGDAGSAFWIGREGIAAALRAFDGREPATLLLDAVRERFGDPAQLYMTLQADPNRVAVTASFAARIAELAEAGDAAADAVIVAAGCELGRSAVAALRASGAPASARLSWQGTVLERNARMRGVLVDTVLASCPAVVVGEPVGTPLDGAAALFDLDAAHPLAAAVHRAVLP